jgi:hypothetical protein
MVVCSILLKPGNVVCNNSKQETVMKILKILLAATLVASVMVPGIAEAKKKSGSGQASAPSGDARKKQFNDVLKQCRKQYGDNMVEVYWGTHYGRKGWWCSHY